MPKPTRNVYSTRPIYNHGRRTLRYCVTYMNLRDSYQPQIKRRYNVFLICPVSHPYTLTGFGVFDAAKLQLFSKLDKKKSLPLPDF